MASIEKRSRNSWRVGEQVKRPDGSWMWVRLPIKFMQDSSDELQRAEATTALAKLQADIAAGKIEVGPQNVTLPALTIDTSAPPAPPVEPEPLDEPVPADALELVPFFGSPDMTVRQLAALWMQEHVVPNCMPVTVKNYKHLLECRILPALGNFTLRECTPFMLTQFVNKLKKSKRISKRVEDEKLSRNRTPSDQAKLAKRPDKTLSPKTVRSYFDCVSELFEKAALWDFIEYNPMSKVIRPKVPKQKVKFLDDDQAVDLLRRLASEENMAFRAAVLLALTCGLRLGEVGALRFSDIRFQTGDIDITRALKYTPELGNFEGAPKSEAGERLIALPVAMLTLLDETKRYYEDVALKLGDRWRGSSDALIICHWDGSPYHHDTPSKQFRVFAEKNGFRGTRFHDLRHTHATILFANNIDAVAVASRLGHSDAATTMRTYAHALRRRDVESAAVMQDLFDRSLIKPDAPK